MLFSIKFLWKKRKLKLSVCFIQVAILKFGKQEFRWSDSNKECKNNSRIKSRARGVRLRSHQREEPMQSFSIRRKGGPRAAKRARGLEPPLRAWKAIVLPLHHARRMYNVIFLNRFILSIEYLLFSRRI